MPAQFAPAAPTGAATLGARPGFPQQRPTTLKAQAVRPNPVAVKPPAFAQATPQGVQQAAQAAMKAGRDAGAGRGETRLAVLYGIGAAEYGPDVAGMFGKAAGEAGDDPGSGYTGLDLPFAAPSGFGLGRGFPLTGLSKRAANGAMAAAASVPPQPQPPGMAAPAGAPTAPPGVAPTPAGGMMPPGVGGPTPPGGQPFLGAMPAPGGPMGGPPMQQPPVPGQPPAISPTDQPVPNLAADLVGQGKAQRTTVGESANAMSMGMGTGGGHQQPGDGQMGGPLAKSANLVIKSALFGQMGRRLGRVGSGYQTVQLAPDRFVPKPRAPLPAQQPLFQQIKAVMQQRQQPYGPWGRTPFAGWNKLSADKFHKPENYDKIRTLPGGRELWAGANDWECGWTWAWIVPAGGNKREDGPVVPEAFLRIDHAACPACKGGDAPVRKEGECREWSKKKVAEWVKGRTKKAAAGVTADEGGEDAPAGPGSPMRGWQWKVLQRDQAEAQKAWLPRLFKSDATPLTELLASPAKSGVLGGLAGAGLGAGAGYALNQHFDGGAHDWQSALLGGGLGALAGGLKGYGSRRLKNDKVTDALRRTPPGATVKDYERVQQADALADKKAGWTEKAAFPVHSDAGVYLGEHDDLARRMIGDSVKAAAGNPTAELLYNAMADEMVRRKFATKAATDRPVTRPDGRTATLGGIASEYAAMLRSAVLADTPGFDKAAISVGLANRALVKSLGTHAPDRAARFVDTHANWTRGAFGRIPRNMPNEFPMAGPAPAPPAGRGRGFFGGLFGGRPAPAPQPQAGGLPFTGELNAAAKGVAQSPSTAGRAAAYRPVETQVVPRAGGYFPGGPGTPPRVTSVPDWQTAIHETGHHVDNTLRGAASAAQTLRPTRETLVREVMANRRGAQIAGRLGGVGGAPSPTAYLKGAKLPVDTYRTADTMAAVRGVAGVPTKGSVGLPPEQAYSRPGRRVAAAFQARPDGTDLARRWVGRAQPEAMAKAAMNDCYANGCTPDGGGGCSCRGECEACNRSKSAAHTGNLKGPIVASASGESEGLSFADAGPVRHGKDAWDDVSRYFKGHKDRDRQPDPFAGKHAADSPAWLKRLAPKQGVADPLASPSSPSPVKEQGGDARTKAADDAGALTTLGGAGLAASAAGGLGSATVGGLGAAAKSYLSGFAKKLKAADPYDPKAAGRVRAFQDAVTGSRTPAERFVNYTDHGSRLMGAPAFRGGATGRDVMEKVYNNPVLSSIAKRFVAKPESFAWTPGKAQHYGEFAKGPVRAAEQLGREMYGEKGEKGLLGQAREAIKGRTAAQAKRVQARIAPRLAEAERAARAAVRSGSAGGRVALGTADGAAASPRLDTLRRRSGIAADVEGAAGKRLERGLKATGAPDPTTQALRLNLQEAHGGRGVNLDTLAHGEQRNLLDRFARTRAGGQMAELFDRKWDGHINQYRGLGDALMTPKRVIDAAGSTLEGAAGRAGRVARGAGKAGLASLALAVPSGMAFSAGRTRDAAAGEAAQQRLADRFAAAVRGKQAADLEKVANPAVVQAGQRFLPRIGQWLGMGGKAAPAAAKPPLMGGGNWAGVPGAPAAGVPGAAGASRFSPQAVGAAPGQAAHAAATARTVTPTSGFWGHAGVQALPSLGGAVGGGFAADSHGQDWRLGAATGALAFNPRFGQFARRGGAGAMAPVHAVRGGIGGNFAGSLVDQSLGAFGLNQEAVIDPTTGRPAIDPGTGQPVMRNRGNFARAGTWLGGGLGAARGVGGLMARGGGNSAVAQAGRDMAVTGAKGMGAASNFTRGAFDPIFGGLRRGANWVTGGRYARLHSPAQAAAAAGRAAPVPGVARRLGQFVGGAGLLGTAGGAAIGALDRKVDDKANEVFGAGLGALDEYADQKFDQYAHEAPRRMAGGLVHSLTDPALRALGLDPSTVHPAQRALMLGGAGLGAAGLATGSPVVGGLGALGMGAGYMANRYNPLTGQPPPGQGGQQQFDPRNELAHQQQQQGGWL